MAKLKKPTDRDKGQIRIRTDPKIKEALRIAAKSDGQTLSGWLVGLGVAEVRERYG